MVQKKQTRRGRGVEKRRRLSLTHPIEHSSVTRMIGYKVTPHRRQGTASPRGAPSAVDGGSQNPRANRECLTLLMFKTFKCQAGTGLSEPFAPGTRQDVRGASSQTLVTAGQICCHLQRGGAASRDAPLGRCQAKLYGVPHGDLHGTRVPRHNQRRSELVWDSQEAALHRLGLCHRKATEKSDKKATYEPPGEISLVAAAVLPTPRGAFPTQSQRKRG